MDLQTLEIIWYVVFVAIMIGYSVLDGFDLGVGALHLFSKTDLERRIFLNAIGPVWDGNEVWLVVLGGALFAGFPYVYATLMSAFYMPVMLLLCGLIFRAVAIEFRSKREAPKWRHAWDISFCIASIIIALGLGLVLGNLVRGLSMSPDHEFAGHFLDLFNPYALLVALLTLAAFTMHGAIFLVLKTEDVLHDKLRRWVNPSIIFFVIVYVITTMVTLIYQPHMTERLRDNPWLFAVALLNVLAIANIPRCLNRREDGKAFLSSCASIAFMIILFAVGTFPNLLLGLDDPATSLTIHNSYASPETLKVLLIIVIIGIPLALAYMISIYYIFRGKVRIDHLGY
jgi:cytochrome d ubiquinol oxidase subunit II